MSAICPDCYDGAHAECIGQGCYCDCQLIEQLQMEESARDVNQRGEVECQHGGLRSMCEQCEQEEQ